MKFRPKQCLTAQAKPQTDMFRGALSSSNALNGETESGVLPVSAFPHVVLCQHFLPSSVANEMLPQIEQSRSVAIPRIPSYNKKPLPADKWSIRALISIG